ncbi:MAG: hypothetical protein IT305_21525 [Chloroflexi bacterium]|nr:hypothetical protein [Chloroflexota bacterium]
MSLVALAASAAACTAIRPPSTHSNGRPLPAAVVDQYRPLTLRLQPADRQADPSERYYNAFGDAWTTKSAPNADIPVILTPACQRYGPRKTEIVDEAEVAFLARSNAPLLFEECATVEFDVSAVRQLSDALRARRPDLAFVGYGLVTTLGLMHAAFHDLDQHHEDFFLHKRAGGNTSDNRALLVNDPPNAKRVMNVGNAGWRDYIARYFARTLDASGMQGFLVDGVMERPLARAEEASLIDETVTRAWPDSLIETLAAVRAAVPPGTTIWINTDMRDGPFLEQALRYADGLIVEDPIGPRSTLWQAVSGARNGSPITRESQWAEVTEVTRRLGKQLVLVVNSNINCAHPAAPDCFSQMTRQEQLHDARYYLAAFLNLMGHDRTYLAYYTPTPESPQFHSAAFFKEWDLPIGQPTGESVEAADNVFQRQFERALVVWNNGDTPYTVDLSGGPLVSLDAQLVRRFTLPGRSGMLFVTPDVIEPGNPSFELPWGWQPAVQGQAWGDLETDAANVHHGARSLHVPSGLAQGGLCREAAFETDGSYIWSAWVKTRDNANPNVRVAAGPDWQVSRAALPTGTADWSEVQVPFEAGTAGAGLACAVVDGTSAGEVWFDGVQIEQR